MLRVVAYHSGEFEKVVGPQVNTDEVLELDGKFGERCQQVVGQAKSDDRD